MEAKALLVFRCNVVITMTACMVMLKTTLLNTVYTCTHVSSNIGRREHIRYKYIVNSNFLSDLLTCQLPSYRHIPSIVNVMLSVIMNCNADRAQMYCNADRAQMNCNADSAQMNCNADSAQMNCNADRAQMNCNADRAQMNCNADRAQMNCNADRAQMYTS